MTGSPLATRHEVTLTPDPGRVIAKLFVPGEDAAVVHSRAHRLVDRIAQLDEPDTARMVRTTLARFGDRHGDLESVWTHHYDLIRHRVDRAGRLSATARLLVGAYFTHEFAVEATALCNPSMVEHHDQTDLDAGRLRTVVSARQIGEGHVSSIGFATAVIGPGTRLDLTARTGPLTIARRVPTAHRRDLLAAGMAETGWDNEVSATVLGSLPERFDDATFERVLGALPPDLLSRPTAQETLERLRRTNAAGYAAEFPPGTPLHRQVLWPATAEESNGMEDARFVRFTGDDNVPVYRATYTAYDGRHIAVRELFSHDLRRFEMTPMRGPAARNKGIALFPRPVGGRHLALSRSDGETTALSTLDGGNRWQTAVPLHRPYRSWELIQVGNCGSPIETGDGWLVLTHGVGPMRRYAVGALLLDLHHPEHVLAELPEPLIEPDPAERDGYVPNVVYSCGGLIHAGTLWIPYGSSDTRIGFATVPVAGLLDAMVPMAR
ncbi:glycoside hydrolase family 130 protein [Virgisporangium ochraceum]|uniref:glycoside hydrolase family 130 protein n=1 Tax=Virgisporangium ochraceum TaxID=65505 RepID=UPI001944BCE2|nr:glycosylase [Virgisporangium ochraceum]